MTTKLISSCHWKTLVLFCLRNKRPENAFLTLLVNYRKIVQKNKLCHLKQQQIDYLIIYDVIYLLLVLFEKLVLLRNCRKIPCISNYSLKWCSVRPLSLNILLKINRMRKGTYQKALFCTFGKD